MTIDYYSGLFEYLNDKNIEYTIDDNIIRFSNSDFSLFLVLESNQNSIDEFLAQRKKEDLGHKKFLVFIWFDLWINKRDVILSKITHICGVSKKVHARKTTVISVNKEDCEYFLLNNHLNQPVIGYKRIGLYLNSEMIALASFAKRRKFRDDSYSAELLQFATKNGFHINGGLSKLIKHFRLNHSFDSLMTYIDMDWSLGRKFSKIGFKSEDIKPPVFFDDTLNMNHRELSLEKTKIFNLGSIKSIKYYNIE